MPRTQKLFSPGAGNRSAPSTLRRAIALGTVVLTAAGALTGCATNNSGGDSDQITLSVNLWSDWTFVQSAAEEFTKENPNVKFEFNAIPDGTYFTKIPSLFKSGDSPDISAVPIDADNYPSYTAAGLLASLDSQWESSGLDANVSDAVDAVYTQDGSKYAIPVGGVGVPVIYYNKDLFEQAGITDVKQTGMTMDEFYAITEKLQAEDIQPLAVGLNDNTAAFRYFAPVFASVCGTDWETKAATGDETVWADACVEQGLDVVAEWKSQGILDSSAGTSASAVAQATFTAGQSAMEMEGTWAVGALRKGNADIDLGWFQMPSASGEPQNIALSNVDSLAVSSGSQHQEEAAEFLGFLAGYSGIWQHGIPASSNLEAPDSTDSVLTEVAADVAENGSAPALDQVTKTDLQTTITNAIIAVVVGSSTAADAASTIAAGV